jgi:hypothetical protein
MVIFNSYVKLPEGNTGIFHLQEGILERSSYNNEVFVASTM